MYRIPSLDPLFPAAVDRTEKTVLLGAVLLFLVTVVAAVVTDRLWLLGLPAGLGFLYLLVQNQNAALMVIVAAVPFSVEMSIGVGALQFPTEPMLLVLLGVWLLRSLLSPVSERRGATPMSKMDLFVWVFIGALGLSVLTTTIPLLSIKLFLNTCWYLGAFYFYPRRNLFKAEEMVRVLRWLFVATCGVVAFVVAQHSRYGFAGRGANISAYPFFLEHGSYAAHLGVVLGLAIGVSFGAVGRPRLRLLAIITALVTFIGTLFSYTRAAWVGVGLLLLFLFVTKAKEFLRFRTFMLVAVVAGLFSVVILSLGIQAALEKQMTSISDVETNLSNLERFNRWMAAVRIIEKHPLLGVGYGTYPVHYYTYHDRRLETPVSDFYGFPHNDYLQFFAEAGIPGILSYLLLIGGLYWMGIRAYFRIRDPMKRNILLGCLAGVLTYLVHSFFNGFLQVDKVAVPFWMSMAFVATLIRDNQSGESAGPVQISGGRSQS
jgi:O-antigen ligase